MVKPASQSQSPSPEIDPKELQEIIDRIDENLAFQQVIWGEDDLAVDSGETMLGSPHLDDLTALADRLKMSSAPLQATAGVGGLKGLVGRLLNVPVHVFGSPQISFNKELRDFLGKLIEFTKASQRQNYVLRSRVHTLEAELVKTDSVNPEDAGDGTEIKALQQEIELLRERIDALEQEINGDDKENPPSNADGL